MVITAKIGTLALRAVKVHLKRKPPEVGDVFEVYEDLDAHLRPKPGTRRSRVRCTEIKDIGGGQVWFCERW